MKIDSTLALVRKVQTIFSLFLLPTLIPFALFYLSQKDFLLNEPPKESLWVLLLTTLLVLLLPIVGMVLYRKDLVRFTRAQNTLQDRLKRYQNASIRKFVICLVGCVLSMSMFMITQITAYAGVYVLAMVLFSMNNPTLYGLARIISTSEEERRAILDDTLDLLGLQEELTKQTETED